MFTTAHVMITTLVGWSEQKVNIRYLLINNLLFSITIGCWIVKHLK